MNQFMLESPGFNEHVVTTEFAIYFLVQFVVTFFAVYFIQMVFNKFYLMYLLFPSAGTTNVYF